MQYKVKTLSVGGAYNKIFYSGAIVTAEDFPPGNIDSLVKDGSLIPYDAEEIVAAEIATHDNLQDVDLTEALEENPEQTVDGDAEEEVQEESTAEVQPIDYEGMEMKELKALATSKGIEYKGNISKKDLIEKLKA